METLVCVSLVQGIFYRGENLVALDKNVIFQVHLYKAHLFLTWPTWVHVNHVTHLASQVSALDGELAKTALHVLLVMSYLFLGTPATL